MSRLQNYAGFTLIEVMIAMVILITGSLGVASLTVSIMRGNTFNNRITTATMLARDRLQDAKNLGYTNVNSIQPASPENYHSISNYSAYRRVTSITANTPTTNMKTVTVSVFWDSDRHSVTLSSILSE